MRLRFIDFVIYARPQDKDRLVMVIAEIWDELVVRSLINAEAGYFKKWFIKLSGKEAEHILDKQVLYNFFFDKIKTLKSQGVANKQELLKTFTEIFYRINLLGGSIVEQQVSYENAYTSYSLDKSKGQVYVLQVSPEKLDGVDALWNLLEETEDEYVAISLIEVLSKLYVRTQLDLDSVLLRQMLQDFVSRCSNLYKEGIQNKDWRNDSLSMRKMQRSIRLLIEIIDLSESFYAVESISLGSLYRG